jgi:Ring finger domain
VPRCYLYPYLFFFPTITIGIGLLQVIHDQIAAQTSEETRPCIDRHDDVKGTNNGNAAHKHIHNKKRAAAANRTKSVTKLYERKPAHSLQNFHNYYLIKLLLLKVIKAIMTTVLSNFMWRRGAERVETEETDDHPLQEDDGEHSLADDEDRGEEGQFVGSSNSADSDGQATPMLERVPDDEDVDDASDVAAAGGDIEAPIPATGATNANTTTTTNTRRSGRISASRRTRVTLRDLEEERELVRRRTSACVLLSAFILLRLWIQAVVSGDFGLLLLCLVFTSWTARFIRHTREREEELDRLISEYDENDEENTLNDARLRRMSFQSQLALAIMQSQMQVMQGGFGHPDGGDSRPGVTDEAKSHWDRFEFKSATALKKKAGYGSVSQSDGLGKGGDDTEGSDEEPHCSICLCEYEDGDKLVSLPCKHIFHDDCISSWTDNNQRCPLCNLDLESVAGSGEDAV